MVICNHQGTPSWMVNLDTKNGHKKLIANHQILKQQTSEWQGRLVCSSNSSHTPYKWSFSWMDLENVYSSMEKWMHSWWLKEGSALSTVLSFFSLNFTVFRLCISNALGFYLSGPRKTKGSHPYIRVGMKSPPYKLLAHATPEFFAFTRALSAPPDLSYPLHNLLLNFSFFDSIIFKYHFQLL